MNMLLYLIVYLVFCNYCNIGSMAQVNFELDSTNINMFKTGIPDLEYCESYLKKFAENSASFTHCIILKAKPVRICEACIQFYMSFHDSYKQILQEQDGAKKCRDVFFNVDRLEVIESMYNNINDIWSRAQCDNCFEWVNKNLTSNLSNDTLIFMELYQATLDCIISKNTENNSSVICTDCMDIYLKLNNVYNKLEKKDGMNNVCMDVVDSMNFTRDLWSNQLDCCHLRKHPEVLFISLTFIVACLPVLFYCFIKLFYDQITPSVVRQTRFAESFNFPSTSAE